MEARPDRRLTAALTVGVERTRRALAVVFPRHSQHADGGPRHVCVSGSGRALISAEQQAELEQQIGGDDIYLAVAPSGSSGYDSAMNQIINALGGHTQFTAGFVDSGLNRFGAYNRGMLSSHGAADIATRVVEEHRPDRNVFAALTGFVTDVSTRPAPAPAGPIRMCSAIS